MSEQYVLNNNAYQLDDQYNYAGATVGAGPSNPTTTATAMFSPGDGGDFSGPAPMSTPMPMPMRSMGQDVFSSAAGPSNSNMNSTGQGQGQGLGQGPNQWYPPIPSLASLPVDKSKTDPKPAYYKLQFGDEVTGFSYYVRTLAVMIGRNVDRHGSALPPPSITAPSVPINPPLDPNQPSPPLIASVEDIMMPQIALAEFPTPPLPPAHTSFSVPPQSPPHPSSAPLSTTFLNDGFAVPPRAQSEGMIDHAGPPDLSFLQDEDYPDIDMGGFGVLEELAEAVRAESIKAASMERSVEPDSRMSQSLSIPPNGSQEGGLSDFMVKLEEGVKAESAELDFIGTGDRQIPIVIDEPSGSAGPQAMEVDHSQSQSQRQVMNDISAMDMDLSQVKLEHLDDLPPPPPPPPPKSSAPVEHVDVDLGPLKSVSRNHAKIEYKADLGHFCLEIFGRNGAWVDDRYFVKGSIVPLAQGSQIQIATRIFSFVLPPSPVSSPTYTHYALDGVTPEIAEDLPYPYNLPPSEVGYHEFYGEPGPGPSSAASMAARAPPAFNAFAAADGYGLGIEGVGENSWVGWGSDDDDGGDSEEDEEELDESGEEWEPSPPKSVKPKKTKMKSKASKGGLVPGEEESELSSVASEGEDTKKKPKKQTLPATAPTTTSHVIRPKPIAPAPAPSQIVPPPIAASITAPGQLPTTIAPADMILPPADVKAAESRKSSVADNPKANKDAEGKLTSPKKVKKKKDKDKEKEKEKEMDKAQDKGKAQDKDKDETQGKDKNKPEDKAGNTKDNEPKTGDVVVDKNTIQATDNATKVNETKDKSAADGAKGDDPKKKKKKKKPKPDEDTVKVEAVDTTAINGDGKEKDKDAAAATPKKAKKSKNAEVDKTAGAAEDIKPEISEKKKKKKKPKADADADGKAADGKADSAKQLDTPAVPAEPPTLAAALPPPATVGTAASAAQPMPTLAAAMGPTSTPKPPNAVSAASHQPAAQPPPAPITQRPGQQLAPVQPGQPGQPTHVQAGQSIPVRPPMPGVRPPSQLQLPNGQHVRPPIPGQPQTPPNYPPGQVPHPQHQPVGPGQPHPSQIARPPPFGHPMQPQNRSTPPAAPPSPVPLPPFYCTELNETPGQPGHIIVNVPIPPSGAGPRPPPGPLLGLDGNVFIGPPPLKPTQTFATIIHRSLQCLPRGRGTLGEVCNWVAGEWEWFRLNVDSGWQNSIRHNLSLNKAFLKVPRIPEDDPESKGSVWIIDPEEGPLFEEKQKKDAQKSASKDKNAESRREKERIRAEERAKKQREAAIEAARNPPQMIQRTIPVAPRPIPRPVPVAQPAAPPAPPAPVSANAKGILQPKAKIVVVMQPITAAMRARSVISTTDANGNLLPFVCDGTTLVLDQSTFGHLTSDIMDKLTLLGAAGAVDVLSAWVINKNKQQATKAAQAKAGTGATAGVKNGMTANTTGSAKPGVSSATSTSATTSAARPLAATPTAAATANKPSAPAAATPGAPAKPVVGAKPAVNSATGKPIPGPAPPGTSLTKVIGMIAAVANAKGDVNTVGPNASALLRYIRVVGVDIDLRVAERIWATGVVPPLPQKKAPTKSNASGTNAANGNATTAKAATPAHTTNPSAKPGSASNAVSASKVPSPAGPTPSPASATSALKPPAPTVSAAPAINKSPAPAPASAPLSQAEAAVPNTNKASVGASPTATAVSTGVKRKLEDGDDNVSALSSTKGTGTGSSASNPIVIGGSAGASGSNTILGASGEQQENKKPRLETSGA
ncbi:uncharacterized protein I303_102648 [Kwoniella dejecticola CBS 10117]|uniref:Pre-rRNA-processing protein fhl1 n=1 Tax=Kwoniella dejecticola CBS 10117 TaxID=1296121 RepID=A0A1A6A9B9_9TREE|nr:uncharacterized protein I303_02662 [Kwoniella dejecticola CBS 10117]OBR86652.1 hypothetical protein I303_02662 [Kwoniella dejecticola CBS 10117]